MAGRHGGAGEGDGHTGEGSGGSVWDGVRDDGATILVAANRSRLMSLVAANILGQNSAAIAATQAEYAEMWAQDAAVMYSYEGASAAASALPPFLHPCKAPARPGPRPQPRRPKPPVRAPLRMHRRHWPSCPGDPERHSVRIGRQR